MTEYIREAIQKMLDEFGDGYTVTNFCIPMGVERVNGGEFESTVWMYEPAFQAGYITDGLLMRAEEIQSSYCEEETD